MIKKIRYEFRCYLRDAGYSDKEIEDAWILISNAFPTEEEFVLECYTRDILKGNTILER